VIEPTPAATFKPWSPETLKGWRAKDLSKPTPDGRIGKGVRADKQTKKGCLWAAFFVG